MKQRKIIYTSILLIIIALTYFLSYHVTLSNINNNYLELLTTSFNKNSKSNYNLDFVALYLKHLENSKHFKKEENKTIEVSNVVYNTTEPIIYIYNTHSDEEYSYKKNDVYNIAPTVKTASYILEDELKKLGINSIVEKENTIELLNQQNLPYSSSYKVSRTLMEKEKLKTDSLVYFIDLHRDSVKKNLTTATIDNKNYAKVMFLLGLENDNYLENKKVMTKMNDYLNTNYRGLSRGIYEKKGKGVNGVYNQDFSENTILIEVGGIDNTVEEVANSLEVIASMIYNYINDNK